MPLVPGISLGIYEKALPDVESWEERLTLAAQAGFDFVEISIDESDKRLARLEWTPRERAALRRAVVNSGVTVPTMCLSGHRKYPLGSASPQIRQRALDIMRKAIELSVDVGIRIVQVAGYDVFYEPGDEGTLARYREGLEQSLLWASQAAVLLGLENVDCIHTESIARSMEFVRALASPWFQLYPDIGNLVAMGYDPVAELPTGAGHILAVHVKDTRLNEIRRVPLGEGCVPFEASFRQLAALGFHGPVLIEMWNEDRPDALQIAKAARDWVASRLSRAWRQR